MSNFFEQELRRLFGDGKIIYNPSFSGRSCFGTLGKDLRVRAEFTSDCYSREFNALNLTVINRTGGPLDTLMLQFCDLLGIKQVRGHRSELGMIPHIWEEFRKTAWFSYQPTDADYETIRQAANQYLDVFRDRQQERIQDGPKLVYICAPLRGDVEKNIEFARQKAQEVFQAGDIPVCPHLMFPPIADPENPAQDQAAREMGLRLVELCQQVNVYGTTLSEGMWAEVNRAILKDIPVKSNLKAITRTQGQGKTTRKGKGAR